jgi:hypothetical protein
LVPGYIHTLGEITDAIKTGRGDVVVPVRPADLPNLKCVLVNASDAQYVREYLDSPAALGISALANLVMQYLFHPAILSRVSAHATPSKNTYFGVSTGEPPCFFFRPAHARPHTALYIPDVAQEQKRREITLVGLKCKFSDVWHRCHVLCDVAVVLYKTHALAHDTDIYAPVSQLRESVARFRNWVEIADRTTCYLFETEYGCMQAASRILQDLARLIGSGSSAEPCAQTQQEQCTNHRELKCAWCKDLCSSFDGKASPPPAQRVETLIRGSSSSEKRTKRPRTR